MAKDFDRHVDVLTVRFADEMQALCRPLKRIGVSYFSYHMINKCGHYGAIVSSPRWAEYYAQNAFYMLDPFIQDIDVLRTGITAKYPQPAKAVILNAADKKFNWRAALLLVEKNQNVAECISLGSKLSSEDAYATYLENLHLIKSFKDHFKCQAQPILAKLQDELIDMKTLKGKAFSRQSSNTHPHPLDCLSSKECSVFHLCYLPASHIAKKLNLSIRTVEHYIENIKFKLACDSKVELVLKAQKFAIG